MLSRTLLGLALPLALLSSPVSAQDLTQEQVKDIVRDVIRENPQLIMDTLVKYEQDKTLLAKKASLEKVQSILSDPSYPHIGNPDAVPSGVVFLDYNCPHCRNTHVEIEAWLKSNPDKSLVILDFPILGPGSVFAARAALVAQEDGRYAEAMNALMSTQGQITDKNIKKILTDAGFDASDVEKRALRPEIGERLTSNYDLAMQLGITGTPGAVFGDRVISGGFKSSDLTAWTSE